MADKKKIDRRSRLYQLPGRHRPQKDLVELSKKAGLASLRFMGRNLNVAAGVRNNWNLRGFILLCFFFAGMASLMDQVLWMRQLGLIFGTTLQSVSTVLAVFMAGLALGSYLFGKMADKTKNPLRLYALLQMGIGAYVMLTPLIFMGLNSAQVSIYASLPVGSAGVTIIRVLLSFLVLIVPATLMGGTLPVIAKYFVRRRDELGGGVGNLYFINTLGAVLGAFLAGFFLIPYIGVLASTFLAASIDLAVGVICYLLYKYKLRPVDESLVKDEVEVAEEIAEAPTQQLSKKQLKRMEREQRKLERLKPTKYSRTMRWVVFAGFAFGGLASLSLEVSWTRVISMVLGSSVYAFSLMLVAFLLGIALGSAIASKFVDRSRHLWVYFFIVMGLIGIAVVVLNPLLGELPLLFVRVFPNVQANFWLLQFVQFLLLLLIMLIPTLLMGAAFPIAAKIYTDDMEHMGGSVGRLYAGNTFGSMVGPLLTGFVIIPLIGMQWSVSLVSIIYMTIAGAVFIVGFKDRLRWPDMSPVWRFVAANAGPKRIFKGIVMSPLGVLWVLIHPIRSAAGTGRGLARVSVGLAGVVVFAVLLVNILIPVLGSWDRNILNSGVFLYSGNYYEGTGTIGDRMKANSQLVFYDEGLMATVAVYDEIDGDRSLTVDGKTDATSFKDLDTELMLGHLPMLLHDKPEEVLLIGLGSGITLGAVETYPSLESVDAVEIEGAVIEAASTYFGEANNDALSNKKLNMIQADARNYVLAQTKADRKYDVITAEPSNPWMAGNSILFTKQQYELYKKVLSDDGIICQWIHYYSMSPNDLKTVVNTFRGVFPNTTLWRTESDILLIGTEGEQSIDFAALDERLQHEDISNDLKRVNVDDIYDVLGMFVMGPDALADFCEGAPIHTDDHPILQFSAPKSLYTETGYVDNLRSLQKSAQKIEDVDSLISYIPDDAIFIREMADQRALFKHYTDAIINIWQGAYGEAINAFEAMLSTGANDALSHGLLGVNYARNGDSDPAVTHLEQAVALNPTDAMTWLYLGEAYTNLQRHEDAIDAYNNAIARAGGNVFLYIGRGNVHRDADDYDMAIADYNTAIDLYPGDDGDDLAYSYRASAYLGKGSEEDLALALSDVNKAININSRQALAYTYRGRIYYEIGKDAGEAAATLRFNRAIAEFRKAISINPGLSRPYLYEGFVQLELGDTGRAISSATQAIDRDPSYVEAYYFRGGIKLGMIEGHSDPNSVRQDVLFDFEQLVTLAPHSVFAAAAAASLSDFVLNIRDELPDDPADDTADHATLYAFRGWAHSISYRASDDDLYKTAAIADFDKVIELAPGTQVAQFALAAKASLQDEQ